VRNVFDESFGARAYRSLCRILSAPSTKGCFSCHMGSFFPIPFLARFFPRCAPGSARGSEPRFLPLRVSNRSFCIAIFWLFSSRLTSLLPVWAVFFPLDRLLISIYPFRQPLEAGKGRAAGYCGDWDVQIRVFSRVVLLVYTHPVLLLGPARDDREMAVIFFAPIFDRGTALPGALPELMISISHVVVSLMRFRVEPPMSARYLI